MMKILMIQGQSHEGNTCMVARDLARIIRLPALQRVGAACDSNSGFESIGRVTAGTETTGRGDKQKSIRRRIKC